MARTRTEGAGSPIPTRGWAVLGTLFAATLMAPLVASSSCVGQQGLTPPPPGKPGSDPDAQVGSGDDDPGDEDTEDTGDTGPGDTPDESDPRFDMGPDAETSGEDSGETGESSTSSSSSGDTDDTGGSGTSGSGTGDDVLPSCDDPDCPIGYPCLDEHGELDLCE